MAGVLYNKFVFERNKHRVSRLSPQYSVLPVQSYTSVNSHRSIRYLICIAQHISLCMESACLIIFKQLELHPFSINSLDINTFLCTSNFLESAFHRQKDWSKSVSIIQVCSSFVQVRIICRLQIGTDHRALRSSRSLRDSSSRCLHMSAQCGSVSSISENSFIAAGTSIFCGQVFAHLPQATQAVGRLSSARLSIVMLILKLGENFTSL